MTELFDYIFYRIHNFYRRRDSAEAYAMAALSVMQFFSLLSIVATIRIIVYFPIPDKLFIIPVAVGIIFWNWYGYERSVDLNVFESRWGAEERVTRSWKGWLIVFGLVLVICFPILLGVFR